LIFTGLDVTNGNETIKGTVATLNSTNLAIENNYSVKITTLPDSDWLNVNTSELCTLITELSFNDTNGAAVSINNNSDPILLQLGLKKVITDFTNYKYGAVLVFFYNCRFLRSITQMEQYNINQTLI